MCICFTWNQINIKRIDYFLRSINQLYKNMSSKQHRIPSYILLILSVLFLSGIQAKVYSQQVGIPLLRRQGCWLFLDRMHLEPGNLKIDFKVKLIANNLKDASLYQLELAAIPSSVWEISLKNKCEQSKFTEEEKVDIHKHELAIHASLLGSNSYSHNTISNLEVQKEETYHFVLRHCSKLLLNDGYGREAKLQVYVDVQNNQKYYSSTESIYGWLLPLLIFFGCCMLRYLYKQKEDDGDNWIKWTLKISLWVYVSSIAVKYLGFVVYAYISGSEYQIFDFFFMLLHSFSDSALLVILLLLAYGWTVTFNNSMDFDLYVPLACMLGFVNIIMTLLNKITDGQHDKYHMYDTIPAYIMIGFRLLGFLIFIGGIVKLLVTINPTETAIRKYVIELAILGTIYLTFLPASMYLITYIDTKYRKEAIYCIIEIIRYLLNIWLAGLSAMKSSTYRKIIDKSFMEKGDKYY